MLRKLEEAHIRLARKMLTVVKAEIDGVRKGAKPEKKGVDVESGPADFEKAQGLGLLVKALGPYVEEFRGTEWYFGRKAIAHSLSTMLRGNSRSEKKPSATTDKEPPAATIWEALFGLPRDALDPYQPLVHLSALFRGKTVPAIDYYTAKVSLLTSLVTEHRSRSVCDFDAASTAFVTFASPNDARRACKYLAVHPSNPLACLVTMAPEYEDLDWVRVMKSTFRAEVRPSYSQRRQI